ncbi:MAG: DinB family protein [Acidobacteriota bacterium]
MILAQQNLHFLEQARELLVAIDDGQFTSRDRHGHASVGAHLRHVLDAYRCFLSGLHDGRVDYDARQRDPGVEAERDRALERLGQIQRALTELGEDDRHRTLRVRCDAAAWDSLDAWTRSTLGRELQFLLSHTVHHYALIAMTLRGQGVEPGEGFGVAPSTLEHFSDARGETGTAACAR